MSSFFNTDAGDNVVMLVGLGKKRKHSGRRFQLNISWSIRKPEEPNPIVVDSWIVNFQLSLSHARNKSHDGPNNTENIPVVLGFVIVRVVIIVTRHLGTNA